MLKFVFWILLLLNGALLAYSQGYLDGLIPSGREPARLAQQFNADKIRLLPSGPKGSQQTAPANPPPTDKPAGEPAADKTSDASPAAQVPAADAVAAGATDARTAPGKLATVALATETEKKTAAEKPAEVDRKADIEKKPEAADKAATTDKKAELLACTEIGNFSEADAGRVEARLAALAPGARLARRTVRETSSHMVFIPPQGSKEGADRKVDQLRGLGVTDFYVIQDQSEMRWGISLGVFSSEDSAKKRLEQLKQQGVRTARIGARNSINKVAFQLRALDAAGREKLDKFKADFPQQQQRNCA